MNTDLMQINLDVQHMSSREIAERTGKAHSNVLRDIRTMLEQIDNSNMNYQQYQVVTDEQTKRTAEILLDKELTLTLVAGYNANLRHVIIKRWQELEAKEIKPPTNYLEALEQLIVKEKALIEAQPKIAHYDAVVERGTLLNATQVAQSVGIKSAQELNKRLALVNVYNSNCKRGKAFQAWFVEQGLGEMKQGKSGHMQPLFSTKGQAWVFDLLN